MNIGRLHVITDTVIQSRFAHEALAEMACAGGADVIQLRDKQLDDASFMAVAQRVREICAAFGVCFIVNDRVEIAKAVSADGVHLGREDAPLTSAVDIARGATAGNKDEALAAQRAGADYIGFGHVYETSSKAKSSPPVGPDALRDVCMALETPVIAIGGITASRVAEVMGNAGAWGVAVIGAVCAAGEPRDATARIADAVSRYAVS